VRLGNLCSEPIDLPLLSGRRRAPFSPEFDLEVIDRHQLLRFREYFQKVFDCPIVHRTGSITCLLEGNALVFKRSELPVDYLRYYLERGKGLKIRLALVVHGRPLQTVTIR